MEKKPFVKIKRKTNIHSYSNSTNIWIPFDIAENDVIYFSKEIAVTKDKKRIKRNLLDKLECMQI